MASSTTSILALALFFIATATHAHALLTINGQNVLGLQVNGTLACSATGNLPGTGIAGILASLTCNINGTPTVVAVATTNLNGVFVALITHLNGLDANSLCNVRVNLPVLACSLLPGTGFLQAQVNLNTSTVIQVANIGLVAQATVGLFAQV